MTSPLTAPQAAEIAQRHPVTVRRALESGELHGSQRGRGGHWRIHPDCLQAWIYSQPCPHQTNVAPFRRRAS